MRYVAAYMLAVMGGNEKPQKEDIKNILSSVGIDAEDDKIDIVLRQMKGKNLEDVLEEGRSRLATIPAGGIAVSSASAGSAEEKVEEKKEEVTEDKEEETDSDDDVMGGLFD